MGVRRRSHGPPGGPQGRRDGRPGRQRGVFGWRSVKAEPPPERSPSSGHAVKKSMRELGIRGCQPRSRKRTTVRDPDAPDRPDLVRGRFDPPVPTTVLCGDIAYLKTGEGRPCLASVVDLSTRMVVGWPFSARMTADMCVSALEMAKRRGYVAGGAIFHSDSKNVISRFCGNRNRAVSCKPGPRRSILTRTPIDWSASVA